MSTVDQSMFWLRNQLHALEPDDSEDGGIYANKSGYHNTRKANSPKNYSVRDAIDQAGPSDKAAGIDWTFHSAQRGNYATIALYCQRLLTASRARDPRLAGWREWYGQADSDSAVEGWDLRYRRAVSSDRSHLWHIHFSEVRAFTASEINKSALRSVLSGETLDTYLATDGKLIKDIPLTIDGILGPLTIARWQLLCDTIMDGEISDTSSLVKAVQRHLNTHGASPKLAVDGKGIRQNGKAYQTVRALQRYLGTPADGRLTVGNSPAVRALQQRLNDGAF